MRYVVGVDGGNSKTLAAVADERGEIRGLGRSGNSNHQATGVAAAMHEIWEAVRTALQLANLERSDLAAAYFALAGADLPEDFAVLDRALAQRQPTLISGLENDSSAALWAGSDAPDAVVVVWGAGTTGAGRNSAGRHIRLPALGSISGDWGGGGDFGREAIWLVARAHDGRGRLTRLTELVLTALECADVDELIARLYRKQIAPARIIALAPLVFQAAGAGDEVASDLVVRGGREVATTARALLAKLDLLHTPADVVLAGSLFRTQEPLFMHTVRRSLAHEAPHARLVRPDVEPVVGALLAALDLLHLPVGATVRARARLSYEALIQRVGGVPVTP